MRTIDTPTSAGLGLRRGLLPSLLAMDDGAVDFLEVAPDNWIGVGGKFGEQLAQLSARFPVSAHGLSLSLGGAEPLDMELLKRTRQFNERFASEPRLLSTIYPAGDGLLVGVVL